MINLTFLRDNREKLRMGYIMENPGTTDWVINDGKPAKKAIAAVYGPAIKINNPLFGSGTAKNK